MKMNLYIIIRINLSSSGFSETESLNRAKTTDYLIEPVILPNRLSDAIYLNFFLLTY